MICHSTTKFWTPSIFGIRMKGCFPNTLEYIKSTSSSQLKHKRFRWWQSECVGTYIPNSWIQINPKSQPQGQGKATPCQHYCKKLSGIIWGDVSRCIRWWTMAMGEWCVVCVQLSSSEVQYGGRGEAGAARTGPSLWLQPSSVSHKQLNCVKY